MYMGNIDPELQDLLDDLHSGYGDRPADDTAVPAAPSLRRKDWMLRVGYEPKENETV